MGSSGEGGEGAGNKGNGVVECGGKSGQKSVPGMSSSEREMER
nr:hypothetical protein [Tanacetum cinerariifolium]